ncbi:MAG: iron chaperone [Actinomycetota bacterium]
MEKPKSVESYFKSLPPEQRVPLQKLRETIAAAAPQAEEGITYSMPGFLLGGKGLFGYMAFRDHYSFFPMSSQAIEMHREELGELVTGKGTISFEYGKRLPVTLVKKVVRTRLAEVAAKPR